jgi:hypothetical protein
MAKLRSTLLECLTEERVKVLGEKLFAAAAAGDWVACELLFKYCLGKPAAAVNPDTLDLDEFRQLIGGPSLPQLLFAMTQSCSPTPAIELARGFQAADARTLERQVDGACERAPETFNKAFRAEGQARAGR